ncbi:esterase-like activity of phytase family protein [Stakelama saccharophila]|uniref:Esterase-like activity of phytase family protein n=1 Tax=Stakelama saccharophila TaxID=3075605 RepID=A0ABZ0BBS3_9SPHN|nr:esterase-like activity of phytase family protein [Stakelama sp. W311]WNO54747.1 esterase-like activity of phytase family protein [Stakelama sp. W311]
MRIVWSVLLLLIFIPGYSGEPRLALLRGEPKIAMRPVPLVADQPGRRRVGALTYLGGVELTSPDGAFGGFSAMQISGDTFLMLNDGGNFVRFRMGSDWRMHDARYGFLRDGPGTGWTKIQRDSESLARDPASGSLWVGFEDANAIWRYDAALSHATGHVAPPVMRKWPGSSGPESMARMPDGSFIVISEGKGWRKGRGRAAVRFAGDPVAHPRRGYRFGYMPPKGYSPSDMTVLPDGRIVVLNRTVRLPSLQFPVKVTLIDPAAIGPGRLVRGRVIATFASPVIDDNYEAIAATREGDATILWIASDDNLSALQRTLLLKFRLDPGI